MLYYILMFVGVLMFSSSLYFLRDYVECIREKNNDPKISSEFAIFALLIIGVGLFSFSCYLVGTQ